MTEVFIATAWTLLGCMVLLWLVSLPLKDVSIVDIFWGVGFIIVAWVTYFIKSEPELLSLLLPILTTVWGLRLAVHLALRNIGKSEDKRYAKMRDKRGESFWWKSLFIIFLLQGVIMWIVSLPLQLGTAEPATSLNALHFVGLIVWLIGFFFEAVGDWQLSRFKKTRSSDDEVLNSGLWRYTRHPNYFGDFMQWWGFYTLCVANSGAYWTVISPIIMSIFLMKISGVTMTEESMKSEKPKYEEYMKRTNTFFPGPPKKLAENS